MSYSYKSNGKTTGGRGKPREGHGKPRDVGGPRDEVTGGHGRRDRAFFDIDSLEELRCFHSPGFVLGLSSCLRATSSIVLSAYFFSRMFLASRSMIAQVIAKYKYHFHRCSSGHVDSALFVHLKKSRQNVSIEVVANKT